MKSIIFKKNAYLAKSAIIFLFIILSAIFLISLISESEISVTSKENYKTIEGGESQNLNYILELNNSGDEEVEGTIYVQGAKPYDNTTPNPSSSIITHFQNKKGEEDFNIPAKESKEIYLNIKVQDFTPAGSYFFQLSIKIDEHIKELDRDLVLLKIEPYYDFAMDLDQKKAKKSVKEGARIDFLITIENKGNVEEEITFKLIDTPSPLWNDNITFDENLLIVPRRKSDDDKNNQKTTELIVIIPNMSLDYEVVENFQFVFRAESTGGLAEDGIIKIDVTGPPPHQPPHKNETYKIPIVDIPFPKELFFIFPIIAMAGGGIIIFKTREREFEEEVPTWEEWEENGIKNGFEKENASSIICTNCNAKMKIPSKNSSEGIKCYKCKSIIVHKSKKKTVVGEETEVKNGNQKLENIEKEFENKEISEKPEKSGLKCPKCDSQLKIKSEKRPITVNCRNCNAKVLINTKNKKSVKKDEIKKTSKSIVCPKCNVKLKINSLKRPLTVHCPKCDLKIVIKGTYKKDIKFLKIIKCPKCKASLKISSAKDSLSIICPKCNSKIQIKENKVYDKSDAKQKIIKCPHCKIKLKTSTNKRPLNIICPNCKTKIFLKGKQDLLIKKLKKGIKEIEVKPISTNIKCPRCNTNLSIKNPDRPLSIKCPKCGTNLSLK